MESKNTPNFVQAGIKAIDRNIHRKLIKEPIAQGSEPPAHNPDAPSEMFCDPTAEQNAHTEGWQHQVEPRYATEHILRPDFFQITLNRGYLSGEAGRYGGLLYFSEGAHYRGRPTTNTDPQLANTHMGFLFDPVDLEYTFGAVPTFLRYHRILEKATNDPEIGSRRLWQKFLNPEPRRERIFSEQTVLSYGKERPYVQHIRQTMQQEQFGLEALLKFQRKYDVDVEPEFVVPHRVPLARAIGVSDETGVYWINPETRGNKMIKWDLFPVDPSELGGREPGSFAPETVQSLIIPDEFKLHGGRRRHRRGYQALYQATHTDNAPSILKHGLDPTRSRGIRQAN